MDERKNILFIVHTEYHMLVAISLIADLFFDSNRFSIWIVQTIGYRSTRFNFVKSLSPHKHVRYEEMIYDEGVSERNEHFANYIKKLSKMKVDHLVSFNKLAYVDFYTIKSLKAKGTKIILGPDGAAAYGKTSRFTPRWSLLLSYNTHRYFWKNGIKRFFFYWPTLVYGGMKEIDELWVQFPDAIDNRAGKVTRKIDVLKSQESRRLARNFFGFASDVTNAPCIFYTNQPFRDPRINDFEIDLLKQLREKFPKHQIVVKLHPTTFPSQAARLSELPNVLMIRSTIPAELIIAELSNSIVLGFWSTSMLVDNSLCRVYWLFPMLALAGIELRKTSINHPSPHIRLVSSIKEIE